VSKKKKKEKRKKLEQRNPQPLLPSQLCTHTMPRTMRGLKEKKTEEGVVWASFYLFFFFSFFFFFSTCGILSSRSAQDEQNNKPKHGVPPWHSVKVFNFLLGHQRTATELQKISIKTEGRMLLLVATLFFVASVSGERFSFSFLFFSPFFLLPPVFGALFC
jgi:hypothetical protein